MQIVTINKYDPQANRTNSIADLAVGQRLALVDFFRNYKTAEGKGVNSFYAPSSSAPGLQQAVFLSRNMTNQVGTGGGCMRGCFRQHAFFPSAFETNEKAEPDLVD
jgi:hypothetical protein